MVSASITVMSAVTVRRGCSLREAVTTTVSSWEVCARCACCACCTCAWAWQASSEAAARADNVRSTGNAEGERRAAPGARARARVCMDASQLRASDPAGTETTKTGCAACAAGRLLAGIQTGDARSEEHTSELQSQSNLVCRLLLEKKKNNTNNLLHSN